MEQQLLYNFTSHCRFIVSLFLFICVQIIRGSGYNNGAPMFVFLSRVRSPRCVRNGILVTSLLENTGQPCFLARSSSYVTSLDPAARSFTSGSKNGQWSDALGYNDAKVRGSILVLKLHGQVNRLN